TNVAVPSGPTAKVPRITLPSMKVTVPVGVPAPGATAATVAVKVTPWPVTAGLSDEPSVTAVAAGMTVTAAASDSLSAKLPGPAARGGGRRATPAAWAGGRRCLAGRAARCGRGGG